MPDEDHPFEFSKRGHYLLLVRPRHELVREFESYSHLIVTVEFSVDSPLSSWFCLNAVSTIDWYSLVARMSSGFNFFIASEIFLEPSMMISKL